MEKVDYYRTAYRFGTFCGWEDKNHLFLCRDRWYRRGAREDGLVCVCSSFVPFRGWVDYPEGSAHSSVIRLPKFINIKPMVLKGLYDY